MACQYKKACLILTVKEEEQFRDVHILIGISQVEGIAHLVDQLQVFVFLQFVR